MTQVNRNHNATTDLYVWARNISQHHKNLVDLTPLYPKMKPHFTHYMLEPIGVVDGKAVSVKTRKITNIEQIFDVNLLFCVRKTDEPSDGMLLKYGIAQELV